MIKASKFSEGIPNANNQFETLENQHIKPNIPPDRYRLLVISVLSVILGLGVAVVAKCLVYLIFFFTNLTFFGRFSLQAASPADNQMGLMAIVIPVIGGLIVGFMAFYGSKGIRGHGIPEAMEQVLTNKSKISPTIAYLKPLSSAIAIGTGGPFGAEGPIIATGSAIGSTFGQLLTISDYERKVLLAAGATAGMSAIFATPVAGIFLAIELLLFEFSPRSIIPIALACISGAAGHHILFGKGAVFPMPPADSVSNTAMAIYSGMGVLIGLVSAGVTTFVYFVEDSFERLPIHWIWWPAIGGLVVGIVGYFEPHTLGVGYDNITEILSGNMTFKVVALLCLLKFLSWSIALSSGNSGGTLAPLFTIGGAFGLVVGMGLLALFPHAGITLPMAGLVGMAAMFAGASRALLTSVVFAIEATDQSNVLLPVLCACTAAYFISYMLMKNTIMTEKLSRRGIIIPQTYEPDILEKISVATVVNHNQLTISSDNSIQEIRDWLTQHHESMTSHYVVVDTQGAYVGIVAYPDLYNPQQDLTASVASIVGKNNAAVFMDDSLRTAVDLMAKEHIDVVPVLSKKEHNLVIGILGYKDLISVYQQKVIENYRNNPIISLKGEGIKIIRKGQQIFTRPW